MGASVVVDTYMVDILANIPSATVHTPLLLFNTTRVIGSIDNVCVILGLIVNMEKEAIKLVEQYSQMMIVPVSAPKAPTPIAMLLPQGDQVWINYVNTWIALKQERGFFDELGKKWKLLN